MSLQQELLDAKCGGESYQSQQKMDAGDASSETIPLGEAMLLTCKGIMAISHNVDAV